MLRRRSQWRQGRRDLNTFGEAEHDSFGDGCMGNMKPCRKGLSAGAVLQADEAGRVHGHVDCPVRPGGDIEGWRLRCSINLWE